VNANWHKAIALLAMIGLSAAVRQFIYSVSLSVVLIALCVGIAAWYVFLRPRRKPRAAMPSGGSGARAYDSQADLPPKGPFVVGRLYRARKTVADRGSSIREGQVLRYLCWGFVPYDELTCYNFTDEQCQRVYWCVYGDEPAERWKEVFEETDERQNQRSEASTKQRAPEALDPPSAAAPR
jgi:hypothetical protein